MAWAAVCVARVWEATDMIDKWVAMATVSVFAGLVCAVGAAGCSQEDMAAAADDGGSNAKRTKKDASASRDADRDDEACYSDEKVDVSTVVYKRARVRAGACSKEVFGKIKGFAESEGGQITVGDLKDMLATEESQGCADCVFAEDGEEWAPVVMEGDQVKSFNFVACVEVKSGSAQCAESYLKWSACVSKACNECSSIEVQDCMVAVRLTACEDAEQALKEACGGTDKLDAYVKQCASSEYVISEFGGSIQELCVGHPITDGGSDGDAN
jgi:hypothetical protein